MWEIVDLEIAGSNPVIHPDLKIPPHLAIGILAGTREPGTELTDRRCRECRPYCR